MIQGSFRMVKSRVLIIRLGDDDVAAAVWCWRLALQARMPKPEKVVSIRG